MSTKALVAKLKDMAKHAGERAYERIKIAHEILQDLDWIASADGGGGDESTALARLQDDCFGDLCFACTLGQMLDIYKMFPNVESWAAKKFRLDDMWAEVLKLRKKAREDEGKTHERASMKELREAQEKVAVLDKEAAYLKNEREELRCEREDLRKRIDDLERENARLKGQVEELQRIMDKFAAKSAA